MIYTGLNNSGEVEAVYASRRVTTEGVPPLSYQSKGYDLEDFLISGNTVQDGTPTPSNPVDVVGCGDRTGNLFDKSSDIVGYRLDASGLLFAQEGYEVSQFIRVTPNSVIRRNKLITTNKSICEYDENQEFISRATQDYALTLSANTHYIRTAIGTEDTNVMLNLGSTALPYEPYGYKILITVNGTEYPIYLGNVQTTRQIKKLVLTGEEDWQAHSSLSNLYFLDNNDYLFSKTNISICSHYKSIDNAGASHLSNNTMCFYYGGSTVRRLYIKDENIATADDLKSYLATEYANGTPVTVWYVLADPKTGIVNEPLHKIGDYADTISLSQSGIIVPTIAGTNTITTGTTVLPSSISVTTPEKEVAEVYAGINYQNPIYYKSRTLTGTLPLTYKGLGQPLKDYNISGNTVQNGTPSPSNPVDVVGCGVRTGNLFDLSTATNEFINSNGSITPAAGPDPYYLSDYISADNVTISVQYKETAAAEAFSVGVYDSSKNFIRRDVISNNSVSYENVAYIRVNYRDKNCQNVMLNLGSTALPYEPYGYKLDISSGGMNFFDVSAVEKGRIDNGVVGYAYDTTDLSITGNKVTFTINKKYRGVCCEFIEIPNGAESISFSGMFQGSGGIGKKLVFYDAQKSWLNADITIGIIENSATVTIPNGAKFVRMSFTAQEAGTASISNFILNTGSTSLPYEPYNRIATPIYLGQVQTTRKIRKLVFDGTEASWYRIVTDDGRYVYYNDTISPDYLRSDNVTVVCSHYKAIENVPSGGAVGENETATFKTVGVNQRVYFGDSRYTTVEEWKTYLQQLYTSGTPVTVWYVLAEPETGIVNEPLHKIGDYVDTVSFTQAGVTIPIVAGSNILDMNSTVKPSAVSITGNIKPTGYGQLLDVNNVDIQDKNNTPIFIHG